MPAVSQPSARLAPGDIARADGVLRRQGWLACTPADFRDAILANALWMRFDPNAAITHGGDSGGLWAIAEGQAVVLPAVGGPAHGIIHIARAPFWFGSIPLIAGEGRVASVTARTPCIAATIPHDHVRQLLAREPGWWQHIALNMQQLFVVTLQALCDAHIRNSDARCAAVLLRLSHGTDRDGSPQPIACTQAELAIMCNMSRQALVPVLDKLEATQLIERGYRSITVRDSARLRALVDAAD
jgi:CRP-like cAMP-binding protein